MGSSSINSPYSPFFISLEEKGEPEDVGVQSMDDSANGHAFAPDAITSYNAAVQDLRIMKPYAADLRRHLGDQLFVLQCRTPTALNYVPDEWKSKATTLLWQVKGPGFTGYVTDGDFSTFYFGSKADLDTFVGKMNGTGSSSSADSLLQQRDRLKKILG